MANGNARTAQPRAAGQWHPSHVDTNGHAPQSILAHDPNAIVINSFSKYFGMTGWRLGWCIVPRELVPLGAGEGTCGPISPPALRRD